MRSPEVYVVGTGKFLPHAPVTNLEMESILGQVGARPSRARRITLRNSGILSRHYAIDRATGAPTYTNAQMTALAVHDALATADWKVADLLVLVVPAEGQRVVGFWDFVLDFGDVWEVFASTNEDAHVMNIRFFKDDPN